MAAMAMVRRQNSESSSQSFGKQRNFERFPPNCPARWLESQPPKPFPSLSICKALHENNMGGQETGRVLCPNDREPAARSQSSGSQRREGSARLNVANTNLRCTGNKMLLWIQKTSGEVVTCPESREYSSPSSPLQKKFIKKNSSNVPFGLPKFGLDYQSFVLVVPFISVASMEWVNDSTWKFIQLRRG
jgi:hypothetical protein